MDNRGQAFLYLDRSIEQQSGYVSCLADLGLLDRSFNYIVFSGSCDFLTSKAAPCMSSQFLSGLPCGGVLRGWCAG